MFSQKKPYTAVTVTVERLTSESVAEDDLSGLPDLIEVINLQDSGPSEASRAIRKKLKYGNLHRQLRALTLLDGLIQNAGPRFQRSFADEALLERLRFCGTAQLSDPEVRKKCTELFRSWATQYKNVRGLEQVANLYRELPKRKQAVTQEKSKAVRETENPFGVDDDDDKPSSAGPALPSGRRGTVNTDTRVTGTIHSFAVDHKEKKKRDKERDKKNKKQHKPFNLEAEKDQMKAHIAEASIAATNLTNTLQTINREKERISENELALQRFEACKSLRRKILRYIHYVESEQWLGSLLHANDELVTALMTFEQLDRSIDADSDSDDDLAEQAHLYRMATEKVKGKEPGSPTSPSSPIAGMAGLSLGSPQSPRREPPPRPSAATKPSMLSPRRVEPSDDEDEDDDDDNPFADRNAVLKAE
ncbi:hypothetical protein QBC35DRAFT_512952 [Podospora australis]|uniref:VHS domain-containing protein n=1 Tax=Podospora australis TaxID=1536484 RepID=A0AAN6WZB2_9PEZI|nr:hypothetical protein QBC35DRAFT_512952 [Podospora australis]